MGFFKKLFGGGDKDKSPKVEESIIGKSELVVEQELTVEEKLVVPKKVSTPKPVKAKPSKEKSPSSKGFFGKIFGGLAKTATAISSGIATIFTGKPFDDDFYDDLMAVLLQTDMGMEAVESIIDDVKRIAKKEHIKTQEELKNTLVNSISNILTEGVENDLDMSVDSTVVMMIVGVNGVGKTTSIGKLAHLFKSSDKSVLVAAADTFRAAACDQLETWTKRAGVRIVTQGEGADPASVVFDALTSAKAKNDDIVIIDTAGRLHNKAHLMEELKKIDRVVGKAYAEATYKKFIVLDATTGQNALSQVEIFNDAVDLDGVILTKLDGTAKGGVVVAIKKQFDLPVLFVGVGEQIDDLIPFDAAAFARALVGVE